MLRLSRAPLSALALVLGLSMLPLACGEGGVGGEICGDGIDNDNDGIVDEGEDLDGDTYDTCDIPELTDCDDEDPDVHPDAAEVCDGADTDCDGEVDNVDVDDDGFISVECNGADCDDADPDAFPGRPESCDGADNDCDGETDEGFDADDDLWTQCAGDCADGDPKINPDAIEFCDGVDNNCNCGIDSNGDGVVCGPGDRNVDEDFDEDGDEFIQTTGLCSDTYGPGGVGEDSGDCDDEDETIFPDAHEISDDGVDNNCDGCVDECIDQDGDGYDNCDDGDDGAAASDTCPAEDGSLHLPDDGLEADCDDSPSSVYAINVHPDTNFDVVTPDGIIQMEELCDRVDNDCDGTIDEGYDPDTCDPL